MEKWMKSIKIQIIEVIELKDVVDSDRALREAMSLAIMEDVIVKIKIFDTKYLIDPILLRDAVEEAKLK